MLKHCSIICMKHDRGNLNKSFIKINTRLYFNVTERG